MASGSSIYRALKRLLVVLVEPLRADETITHFTLSVPEARTTTVDGVQGLQNRPPAVLRCPDCGGDVYQRHPMDALDCSGCWREYPAEEFSGLELLAMVCPRCDTAMRYGNRHPGVFDAPEWATCSSCQYHWDLDHWF